MEMCYAPNGNLQIDNARIIFRNFKGEGGRYNHAGDRNFAVVIPDYDQAMALKNDGWNVKIKDPKEPGDTPFMYLPVKVKFNGHSPRIYLETLGHRNKIDEDQVDTLDDIEIESVSMDIRPYNWEVQGDKGKAAYLYSMNVVQLTDRFARYEDTANFNNARPMKFVGADDQEELPFE